VNEAVEAAGRAFNGPWRRMSASDRGRLLTRLAESVEQHTDEFAHLETLDNGKPVHMAPAADLPLTIATYRYYSGWADEVFKGSPFPSLGSWGVQVAAGERRNAVAGVAGERVRHGAGWHRQHERCQRFEAAFVMVGDRN
jgi:acyl-CoA reductase-like NAD-dependent aldehyde dehydrogenase